MFFPAPHPVDQLECMEVRLSNLEEVLMSAPPMPGRWCCGVSDADMTFNSQSISHSSGFCYLALSLMAISAPVILFPQDHAFLLDSPAFQHWGIAACHVDFSVCLPFICSQDKVVMPKLLT